MKKVDRPSYTHYVSEQREKEASEERYELVKTILEKLPENESLVITLYYLGEMTTREISEFLEVSVNTITSQLQRARRRLKKNQENLIQEVLSDVQISTGLVENVIQQIVDRKSTSSSDENP